MPDWNLPADVKAALDSLVSTSSALYRATVIFDELPDGTSRGEFVDTLMSALPALNPERAERAVDRVIRSRAMEPAGARYGPHPTEFVTYGPDAVLDLENDRLRRLATNMEIEQRPKHDPVPDPAAERAESDARIEARRLAVGLPSGLLRTVDYDPAQNHTPPTWLVKGLFPERGLGMLVGESQAGKSFLAIHAAVSIARGLPFFGRKVKPGGVLYIAAEGGSAVLPRIKAADEGLGGTLADNHFLRKGLAPMARGPIKVMVETPNLSRDGDPAALARTLRAVHRELAEAGHPLTFVVLDTYHAALCGGDEQSAADAGHALKPLKDAAEELGLFVLIVHHPGKDLERGARGSSALRAAVDTEIEIRVPGSVGPKAKPAALARRATVTKQRDGAVGDDLHFRLNTVQLGRDKDGEWWTTCTVHPCAAPEVDSAGMPKGKGDIRLKRALEAAVAERGQARVEMRVVRGFFNNSGPPKETDGARRAAWSRAIKAGLDARTIETDSVDEFIWFTLPTPAGEA